MLVVADSVVSVVYVGGVCDFKSFLHELLIIKAVRINPKKVKKFLVLISKKLVIVNNNFHNIKPHLSSLQENLDNFSGDITGYNEMAAL